MRIQCSRIFAMHCRYVCETDVNSCISSVSWYACTNAKWRQGYWAPNFNYDPSQFASIRSGFIYMKIRQLQIVDVRFIELFKTIEHREAGYRSSYLSHEKCALYHVSYIPILFELVHILPNKLSLEYKCPAMFLDSRVNPLEVKLKKVHL